jgi:hypothetical protein
MEISSTSIFISSFNTQEAHPAKPLKTLKKEVSLVLK